MSLKADFPQSRALMLNHCSVSEPSGIQLGTVGRPSAVAHEGTEAHEGRSGTRSGEVELVIPDGGGAWRGDEGRVFSVGGGTPP